ncbi:CHY zinc finger protein [Agromyces sp. NPDC058484]|uniref:CHY zinc finger protein n=1 Tax=Agromyces sp. NPDC058484 TaxID=3346524 RepID=UPI003648636D
MPEATPTSARSREAGRPHVHGLVVDEMTRCVHYRTEVDIVAIRFACCGEYYPCHRCHADTADHPAEQWPVAERDREAVLCGACDAELTIAAYLATTECPECGAAFNERCRLHTHFYFEDEG